MKGVKGCGVWAVGYDEKGYKADQKRFGWNFPQRDEIKWRSISCVDHHNIVYDSSKTISIHFHRTLLRIKRKLPPSQFFPPLTRHIPRSRMPIHLHLLLAIG